jgi:hypothetical protein
MSRSPSLDDLHNTDDALRHSDDQPVTTDKEYQVQVFEFFTKMRDMLKTKLNKTHEEAERLLEDNLHISASLAKDLTESDHHSTAIMEKFQTFYDDLSQTLRINLQQAHIDEARRLLVQEVNILFNIFTHITF